MSAQPAEHPEDPLDPQGILRELPDRERANFLAAYREPWTVREIRPDADICGGMLLGDYIRLRRTQESASSPGTTCPGR